MSDCFCTATYQCLACEKASKPVVRVQKAPRASIRPVAVCGTRAGYNRHRRLKEATCQECRAAQTASVRKWQVDNPLRHGLIKERHRSKWAKSEQKATAVNVEIGPRIARRSLSMGYLRRSAKSVVISKRLQGGKEGAGLCKQPALINLHFATWVAVL